ncbi:MAG: type III-B CRISPR module-associated protein Cmr5 [Alicyclobacillus sp.]|nr:type III-B CRISPR module-associated protein Cmr5 [Alicyclobacillus sp.]
MATERLSERRQSGLPSGQAENSFRPLHARLMETAYRCVEPVRTQAQVRETYLSLARQLPALLHSGGVLQTIAFLRRKSGGAYEQMLEHLHEFLIVTGTKLKSWDDLQQVSVSEYVHISRSLFQGAEWLKRYSDILLATDAKDSEPPERDNPSGKEDMEL